jgi:hypothetical protein
MPPKSKTICPKCKSKRITKSETLPSGSDRLQCLDCRYKWVPLPKKPGPLTKEKSSMTLHFIPGIVPVPLDAHLITPESLAFAKLVGYSLADMPEVPQAYQPLPNA